MTFHTLLGYQVTYDLDDNVIEVKDTSISIELPNGSAPNLTYTFETPGNPVPNPDEEELPLVNAQVPGALEVELLTEDLENIDETYIGYVNWDGNTTYILSFHYGPPGVAATDWYFVIGGDELPEFTNSFNPSAEWLEFADTDNHITGVGPVTSGAFAPNRSIPLANLEAMTSHTGQFIESYDAADNEITTGAGNDAVSVGGGGWDVVRTMGGDDFVIVDDESGYTEAQVDLGAGDDVLDFADVNFDSTNGAYTELVHNDQLTNRITAIINGDQNVGHIDKGGSGSTVILELQSVVETGGFGIHGTAFNDVLNLTSAENGFMQVRGLGGNDRINIGESNGILRLDYRGDTSGIDANLETGIILDGFGGRDTINGHADELRASMHNDNVIGSDEDDRFILMAGNDTLDGGDGFDTVRYDRSQVGAVNVDLEAGTATGIWRGQAFEHTISNVEAIRGSRDDADTLAGNSSGNNIRGAGGNDTLLGRAGEDTLVGQEGDDSLDGGAGYDVAEFWGMNIADAQITEASAGVVQVVSSLGTDLLTNVEQLNFDDGSVFVHELFPVEGEVIGSGDSDVLVGSADNDTVVAGGGADDVDGGEGDDSIDGGTGNDILEGGEGEDTLLGGDGTDTLIGGEGNDSIVGGDSPEDRRDVVYGGSGDDLIFGTHGNDELRGDAGNDTVSGGFGVDTVIGGTGDDFLTGSAWADLVFGGSGNDFVNGGFGHDRVNGGSGADVFFHLGIFNHGSDWIQDYNAIEGDILQVGLSGASRSQFQVNYVETVGAGDAGVEEAFVIHRPTGQILWALVDGSEQTSINIQIGSTVYDLLL